MGNMSALLLLLLLLIVSSSRFLLHEARHLQSSTTKENMAAAVRKGSGGHGSSGSAHGVDGNGDSASPYGKAIPLLTAGAKPKHNKHSSAHSGYNFSIAALVVISALWLEFMASLCA